MMSSRTCRIVTFAGARRTVLRGLIPGVKSPAKVDPDGGVFPTAPWVLRHCSALVKKTLTSFFSRESESLLMYIMWPAS